MYVCMYNIMRKIADLFSIQCKSINCYLHAAVVQGAVLGPGEFFEGLSLGSRQFVGGTIGIIIMNLYSCTYF